MVLGQLRRRVLKQFWAQHKGSHSISIPLSSGSKFAHDGRTRTFSPESFLVEGFLVEGFLVEGGFDLPPFGFDLVVDFPSRAGEVFDEHGLPDVVPFGATDLVDIANSF